MFALIDVGERAGTGLCNVFNVWKQYGYSEPVITESVDPDRITMVININDNSAEGAVHDTVFGVNVANSTENGANSSENGANSSENGANSSENGANSSENGANSELQHWNFSSLTKCERAVLDYMSSHSSARIEEICAGISFAKRTVQRSVTHLEETGYLLKNGNRSNRSWVLNCSSKEES